MKCDIIKNFVIPYGKYFEDVVGTVCIEGFNENGIEIAEVMHWDKVLIREDDTLINSIELSWILNREFRIGIFIGRFSKEALHLAERMKKGVMLIDKKVCTFGYVPTSIIKNVLVGWKVMKNEIVEK